MKPAYEEFADKTAAAKAAGSFILEKLVEARRERGIATLAVSGGSTPQLMFEQLALRQFDWKNVHLFWVDERCVHPSHSDSNYGMTRKALLEPVALPDEQVHRIEGERSAGEAAKAYVEEIRRFFGLERDSLPSFDVVHLGMGADTHTASLFPGDRLIEDRKQIAAAVSAESRQSQRVTLLPGTLLNAGTIVFLVSGAEKADALQEVFCGVFDPLSRPAQLIAHEGKHVQWFLDREAAAKIGRATP